MPKCPECKTEITWRNMLGGFCRTLIFKCSHCSANSNPTLKSVIIGVLGFILFILIAAIGSFLITGKVVDSNNFIFLLCAILFSFGWIYIWFHFILRLERFM